MQKNVIPLRCQRLFVCPAAFDRTCHRIGYGGGFYDRYLSRLLKNSDAAAASVYSQVMFTTAALAYDCQISEKIAWEVYDIRPMCIITEREIIKSERKICYGKSIDRQGNQ